MRKSRKYTEEFRKRAVELAETLGNTSEAAKQLGIDNANIYGWRTRLKAQQVTEMSNRPENAAEELARLRRENNELRKVNHILKAAAAFFSQDHLK